MFFTVHSPEGEAKPLASAGKKWGSLLWPSYHVLHRISWVDFSEILCLITLGLAHEAHQESITIFVKSNYQSCFDGSYLFKEFLITHIVKVILFSLRSFILLHLHLDLG